MQTVFPNSTTTSAPWASEYTNFALVGSNGGTVFHGGYCCQCFSQVCVYTRETYNGHLVVHQGLQTFEISAVSTSSTRPYAEDVAFLLHNSALYAFGGKLGLGYARHVHMSIDSGRTWSQLPTPAWSARRGSASALWGGSTQNPQNTPEGNRIAATATANLRSGSGISSTATTGSNWLTHLGTHDGVTHTSWFMVHTGLCRLLPVDLPNVAELAHSRRMRGSQLHR